MRGVVVVVAQLAALAVPSIATAQPSASFPMPEGAEPSNSVAVPNDAERSQRTWTTPPTSASGQGSGHGGADGGQSAPSAGAGAAGGTAGAPSWQFAAGAPAVLPYRDGPVPDGYVLETQRSSAALVAGGLILAIPYATGLGIAAVEGFANNSGWLAAPVIGPWLALSGRDDPCASVDSDTRESIDSAQVGRCVGEPIVRGILVVDGVLQATGAVLMLIGYGNKEQKLVRADLAGMRLTPARVGSGWGMGGAGRF